LQDEDEKDNEHGQRVGKIFHDADFIVNLDTQEKTVAAQVSRFCELLFYSNSYSPSRIEYGMFAAKGAALRTLDLSRQVGAAIFTQDGEIISLGSNEVPRAKGGTYWEGDEPDDREYIRRVDSNDERKREILAELAQALGIEKSIEEILRSKEFRDSQFMDALEYGRIVHAEMSAISDAARLGRTVKGGTLYCTTFPCHMCAKHVVAAGIMKVVFLEPYPKSLVLELHNDSIQIEGTDRGKFQGSEAVRFEHFFGVTPRRYRELFERQKRKTNDGRFKPYVEDPPIPYVEAQSPFYVELEKIAVKFLGDAIEPFAADDPMETPASS
jgi:deoxycytidylate deaminase